MKNILYLLTGFCFLFLASCKDNPEKFLKDHISFTKESTEILNDITDGTLESDDAVRKIKTWYKKGEKIEARRIKILQDASKKDLEKARMKHGEKLAKATLKLIKARKKLENSNKVTEEISAALSGE